MLVIIAATEVEGLITCRGRIVGHTATEVEGFKTCLGTIVLLAGVEV